MPSKARLDCHCRGKIRKDLRSAGVVLPNITRALTWTVFELLRITREYYCYALDATYNDLRF